MGHVTGGRPSTIVCVRGACVRGVCVRVCVRAWFVCTYEVCVCVVCMLVSVWCVCLFGSEGKNGLHVQMCAHVWAWCVWCSVSIHVLTVAPSSTGFTGASRSVPSCWECHKSYSVSSQLVCSMADTGKSSTWPWRSLPCKCQTSRCN